ncbi:MAG TPA: ABC transporter ATP-binding protein [Cytophagaceae bacterium]|jgi:ABC-2 type transport system ATP-binding protein|nr:ABC transporter ATP-binding protein [Cytophagaceae bacterium]
MSNLALSVNNLSFRYAGQSKDCIHDLSFEIFVGERFGLFGPNGAGKTTLMSLMVGLQKLTEGSIHLLDKDIRKDHTAIKRFIGYVPQDFAFYSELSPAENLDFFGAWSGLDKHTVKERTATLLEVLGLSDVAHKPVKQFSGGMKRRVNLSIGVIHQPQILFLDEPTVGVDVQTRHAIIDYLKMLNAQGTTLVYTSHHLKEAEDLCERIALIDGGEMVAYDHLNQLLQRHGDNGLEDLFLKLTGSAYRD